MVFDMRPYQHMGEPIGDPHGGTAYGEKNSKLFKKVLSIGMAVAGVALAIPTGGLSLQMTLMQGIAFAGAALNAVGTITGNNTLSKIGGFASLGAGLATAFSGKSALWNSLGTDTNATGLSAASNEASKFMQVDPLKNAVDAVSSGAESLVDTAASTSGIGNVSMMQNSNLAGNALSNANDVGSAIGSGSTFTGGDPLTASYTSQAAGGASSLIGKTNLADSVAQNVGGVATESLSAADNFGIAKTNMGTSSSALPDITTNTASTGLLGMAKDAGTGVLSFIKNNPVATKLVGDFIQGAYQSPQDKAKAQAYIDYYNQQTAVSKQQQVNANAIPTMNLSINPNAPVQFNTAVRSPRGMGLLNRNQQV